jgi:hypothetical protein
VAFPREPTGRWALTQEARVGLLTRASELQGCGLHVCLVAHRHSWCSYKSYMELLNLSELLWTMLAPCGHWEVILRGLCWPRAVAAHGCCSLTVAPSLWAPENAPSLA